MEIIELDNGDIIPINDTHYREKYSVVHIRGTEDTIEISRSEAEVIKKILNSDIKYVEIGNQTIAKDQIKRIEDLERTRMTEQAKLEAKNHDPYGGAWKSQSDEEHEKVSAIIADVKANAKWYKSARQRLIEKQEKRAKYGL